MRMLTAIVPNLRRIAIVSDLNIPRVNGVNPLEEANERAARARSAGRSSISSRGWAHML